MNRFFIIMMATLSLGTLATAEPITQTFFFDFEDITVNTVPEVPFVMGTSPNELTFDGQAFAGTTGTPELYHSGTSAWMILPDNGIGTIEFESAAAVVEFYLTTANGASRPAVVTSFDDEDTQLQRLVLPGNRGFTLVSLLGEIRRVEIENFYTSAASIDDLGFTPVVPIPEPSTAVLFTVGLGLMFWKRAA